MDAPQSRDEIDPIETAIREQIDDQLRLRWNPRSFVTRPGAFDAYGLPIPPQHEGRWEVVRPLPGLEGEPAVIYQVRYDGDGNEAYRAVGWWLLDFLRKWDRQNQHWMDEMKRMYAADEAAERAEANDDEEHAREQWDVYAHALAGNDGREQWPVSGFGSPASGASAPAPSPALTPTTASVP